MIYRSLSERSNEPALLVGEEDEKATRRKKEQTLRIRAFAEGAPFANLPSFAKLPSPLLRSTSTANVGLLLPPSSDRFSVFKQPTLASDAASVAVVFAETEFLRSWTKESETVALANEVQLDRAPLFAPLAPSATAGGMESYGGGVASVVAPAISAPAAPVPFGGGGGALLALSAEGEPPMSSGIGPLYRPIEQVGNSFASLRDAFNDPNGDSTYSIVSNSNTDMVAASLNANDDVVLQFTADVSGVAEIDVRATDGNGQYADDTLVVFVVEVTDVLLQVETEPGSGQWTAVDENQWYWSDDDAFRLTAYYAPEDSRLTIDSIEWFYTEWDQRDDPGPNWRPMATAN